MLFPGVQLDITLTNFAPRLNILCTANRCAILLSNGSLLSDFRAFRETLTPYKGKSSFSTCHTVGKGFLVWSNATTPYCREIEEEMCYSVPRRNSSDP
jgi:hypothetical protein